MCAHARVKITFLFQSNRKIIDIKYEREFASSATLHRIRNILRFSWGERERTRGGATAKKSNSFCKLCNKFLSIWSHHKLTYCCALSAHWFNHSSCPNQFERDSEFSCFAHLLNGSDRAPEFIAIQFADSQFGSIRLQNVHQSDDVNLVNGEHSSRRRCRLAFDPWTPFISLSVHYYSSTMKLCSHRSALATTSTQHNGRRSLSEFPV